MRRPKKELGPDGRRKQVMLDFWKGEGLSLRAARPQVRRGLMSLGRTTSLPGSGDCGLMNVGKTVLQEIRVVAEERGRVLRDEPRPGAIVQASCPMKAREFTVLDLARLFAAMTPEVKAAFGREAHDIASRYSDLPSEEMYRRRRLDLSRLVMETSRRVLGESFSEN